MCIVSIPFCFFSFGQLASWGKKVEIQRRLVWQCVAVILLRRYRPDIPQPYTMWFYPLPALLSLLMWLYIFFTGPVEGMIFSLGFLLLTLIAYPIFVRMTPLEADASVPRS